MSPGEEKAKRWRIWRPRFSVRTLAIFVTLVCVYFGAWEATKRYGLSIDESRFITEKKTGRRYLVGGAVNESSPMPFVVRRDESAGPYSKAEPSYYLWLFGPKIKLPYESTWE